MNTTVWIIVGVGIWIVVAGMALALVSMASRKSPSEQAREDEEQVRYLSEYAAKKDSKKSA